MLFPCVEGITINFLNVRCTHGMAEIQSPSQFDSGRLHTTLRQIHSPVCDSQQQMPNQTSLARRLICGEFS
jgi:hypothetical protein